MLSDITNSKLSLHALTRNPHSLLHPHRLLYPRHPEKLAPPQLLRTYRPAFARPAPQHRLEVLGLRLEPRRNKRRRVLRKGVQEAALEVRVMQGLGVCRYLREPVDERFRFLV